MQKKEDRMPRLVRMRLPGPDWTALADGGRVVMLWVAGTGSGGIQQCQCLCPSLASEAGLGWACLGGGLDAA
jgi:hypothetical protein